MNLKEMGSLLDIQVPEIPEEDVLDMLERGRDTFDKKGDRIKGPIKHHILNAHIILENDSRMMTRFTYNEFNDQIYIEDQRLKESDITRTQLWIQRTYGVRIPKQAVSDLIISQSEENSFHPLQEYLLGLEWDGEVRLETILQKYWGVSDTPLLRAIGKCWAISCVARALSPGAKVDTVLILCGQQGAYKSSSLRALAGGAWFSDSHLDISRKEAYELIHSSGVWLWEMAENYALNKSDVNNAKMFLSSHEDKYRPSYGRFPVTKQRSVVFVSTTNESSFLTDSTGNRRYWPVNIGHIDLEAITEDRNQLWAEAVHYFSQGEQWWLDPEHELDLYAYQEEFVLEDPWISAVDWCASVYVEGFQNDDVFDRLQLPASRQNVKENKRVNQICISLGLVKKRLTGTLERKGISRPRVWICQ
jgi:predicted P-loop ATPase